MELRQFKAVLLAYVPSMAKVVLRQVPLAAQALDLWQAGREAAEKLGLDPNWAVPAIEQELGGELSSLSSEDRQALVGMVIEALNAYLPEMSAETTFDPGAHADKALENARAQGLGPGELEEPLRRLLKAFFDGYLSHAEVFDRLGPGVLQRIESQLKRFERDLEARVVRALQDREKVRAWNAAVNLPQASEPARSLGFDAISAKRGVVRFTETGVFREVAELLDGLQGPAILHFAAPGGWGKTRLWIELSRQLNARGWVGGFLNPGVSYETLLTALEAEARPVFLVVDYAESRYQDVRTVADAAARSGAGRRPFVLALLGRERVEYLQQLRSATSDEWGTGFASWLGGVREETFELGLLGEAEAKELFLNAYKAFARLREEPPAREAEEAWSRLHESLKAFPLNLVLAAYLAVVGDGSDADGSENLIARVLDYELTHWLRRVGVDGGDMVASYYRAALERLAAIATLAGGISREEATHHYDKPYVLAGESGLYVGQPIRLRDALLRMLPGPDGGVAPLEPDPVADHLLASLNENDPRGFVELLRAVLAYPLREGGADGEAAFLRLKNVANVLQRAFGANSVTLELLERALDGLEDYPAAELGRRLLRSVEQEGLKFDPNAPLLTHVLYPLLLPRLARGIEGNNAEKAFVGGTSALALSHFGRHQEALEATQEATELYRRLAQQNPDTFLPYLATSLNNLGIRLANLGHHQEAFKATREAVQIRRKLAQQNPDTFLPYLATSLNNLGIRLANLGRPQEALETTREAVQIRRKLAQQNPDTFLPDLAMSLNNLGSDLSALGRPQEALEATRVAVQIRGPLAEQDPDTFLPDLAMSLNNLGSDLSALGRHQEALEATRVAVQIRRRLAKQNPATFLPYLARSLDNLGARLSALGRHQEALEAAQEAVELRRQLAKQSPAAFLPDLARSLFVNGLILSQMERNNEAYSLAKEAILALKGHFLQLPDAFCGIMSDVIRLYRETSKKSGKEPDDTLLRSIVEVLQRSRCAG